MLVDEYQDTNALQDAIYFALARPEADNLFFVGDIKQMPETTQPEQKQQPEELEPQAPAAADPALGNSCGRALPGSTRRQPWPGCLPRSA